MNVKGISRIDSKSTHGWLLRIYYEAPEVHRKFFTDSQLGGREKALEQAKKYKKEYELKNPPPEKYPFHRKPLPANKTGVNGISETFQRNRAGDKIPCFQVFYAPQKDDRKMKRFYHHHYSSRNEAFEEAVKFRKEKEAEILKLHKMGKR